MKGMIPAVTAASTVTVLGAVSTLAVATATLIAAIAGLRRQKATHAKVEDVAAELATLNGKTVGEMVSLTEGRRILTDVPLSERTASERYYVEQVALDND